MVHATPHRREPLRQSFALRKGLGIDALLIVIEGIFDAMHNIIRDMDVLENLTQFLRDLFFTKIRSAALAPVEQWGNRWLKHGSAAGWFAYFLRTESGQVLLEQGVKQLAAVVDSLPDREWHDHGLGSLLTEVLSLCWKHRQKEVENEWNLRQVFLHVLAVLCARQVAEALHLRSKVSESLSVA